MIRVVSVNAFNLYDGAVAEERFGQVERMIRGIDADIVAVQEVVARAPATARDPDKRELAARRVRRLAEAVGRCCDLEGVPVCAVGGGMHHTALLWRAGIEPVAGRVGRFERDAGMWHSLVTAEFDLGGPRLRVGSVQLSPFDPGRGWGWRDAGQIMRAMNSDAIPGVVGGDYNGLGADPVYDPDPYAGVAWCPDHAFQLDEHGEVDRSTARRLEGPGRFRDCARIANAAWAATTGRHPADRHPPRRIDRWYATYHCPDAAITGLGVAAPEVVGECTDHDPVVVEINESALEAA